MVITPANENSSVCSSWAPRNVVTAGMPSAPWRFSTTTGWLQSWVRRSASSRPAIAELLALPGDLLVVVHEKTEMIEAARLAVELVGVDGEIHIAVGQRD